MRGCCRRHAQSSGLLSHGLYSSAAVTLGKEIMLSARCASHSSCICFNNAWRLERSHNDMNQLHCTGSAEHLQSKVRHRQLSGRPSSTQQCKAIWNRGACDGGQQTGAESRCRIKLYRRCHCWYIAAGPKRRDAKTATCDGSSSGGSASSRKTQAFWAKFWPNEVTALFAESVALLLHCWC